jgi:hypothetical protein
MTEEPKTPAQIGFDPELRETLTWLCAQKVRSAAASLKLVRGMLEKAGLRHLEGGAVSPLLEGCKLLSSSICEDSNDQGEYAAFLDMLDLDDLDALSGAPGRTQ